MKSEQELLHAIQKGEKTAMHDLYTQYSGYAMAVCLRYIPDRDVVRDVMQDSFVKILTSIRNFHYRGEGSLKAWIMKIAANEALDSLRKSTKLSFTDNVPDNIPDEKVEIEGVPTEVIDKMISSLPDGYRVVLNMYVFEQKSHNEIAKQLGINPSTSASQYLRAKKMLAKKINEYTRSKNI